MQVCMNCFQELFDADKECIKCKSQNILSTAEYNECKKFFMYHDKDIKVYTEHPYSTYLKYLNHKYRREKFEYERLHPSYTVGRSSTSANSTPQKTTEKCVPKCPTCGSTNVKKIGYISRGVSTYLWGLASKKITKQWHCNHCGSDF